MSYAETVESYLIRTEVPHEQVDTSTWLVTHDNPRHSRIVVKIQDPIVLFSTPILEVGDATPNREGLFRRLLELNGQLLHAAYGLQKGQVVLSGAQEAENLDLNEFQAVLDDMTMALDNHLDQLTPWTPASANDPANDPGAQEA